MSMRSVQVLGALFEEFRISDPIQLGQHSWRALFDDKHSLVLSVEHKPNIQLQIVQNPTAENANALTMLGMGYGPPNQIIFAPLPLCLYDSYRYPKVRKFIARSLVLYSACCDYILSPKPQATYTDADMAEGRILN